MRLIALAIALAALVLVSVGCGAAVSTSTGEVVADEVQFDTEGKPRSPYTGNEVEPYTNQCPDTKQHFRWVEQHTPCLECKGAGTEPRALTITMSDPLGRCLVCKGEGFLVYGGVNTPAFKATSTPTASARTTR